MTNPHTNIKSGPETADPTPTRPTRRHFIASGTGAAIALSLRPAQTQAQPLAAATSTERGQSEIADQIKASTAAWKDGLSHPIPYANGPGLSKERGLVLGGGGIYLLAWTVGYFHALKKNGVDLNTADIVVGTSAGSIAGAMLTSGSLWRFQSELEFFAEFPKLFARLVPALQFNESQNRAREMAVAATDASPVTIQAIGHAALAARNPDGPEKYPEVTKDIIAHTKWPSASLHTTAVDAYTGERLVVSNRSNIPVNVACAASSSLPGAMGPTWLHDRLCMDGGICQTSTHSDVVSGVKRALIISLSDGSADAVKLGLRTSGMPNALQQEVKNLEAAGTQTRLVVCGLLPGQQKVDSIMDPQWISPMMQYGHDRGMADLSVLKTFWN